MCQRPGPHVLALAQGPIGSPPLMVLRNVPQQTGGGFSHPTHKVLSAEQLVACIASEDGGS